VQAPGSATGLPVSGAAPSSQPVSSGSVGGNTNGASSSGGASGGGAASAPPVLSACAGRQVQGDPYAPPCVKFSGGNGGATSPGVTATNVTVSYRIPADNVSSAQQAIQQIAGKYNASRFADSPQSVERTLSDLIAYFNQHFQFYGRKIVLEQYNGQGQLGQEITGGGQAAAQSDAIHVAQSMHAFADVSALSQPYAEALSAQRVVNIGVPYMSQEWFQQHAPYSWSFFPSCTDLSDESAAIALREMVNQNVTWGGTGVRNGQPRKTAIIAPDNPAYQQCAHRVLNAMASAGHPAAANLTYTLDLSQLSQEAASLEQQIVNDGITTIGCGCDPITLVYLTGDLENAHYEPEWVNIGAAFTDIDLVAQLFNQPVWAHAMGVSNNGDVPPYGGSLGYFAAKSVDPGNPPAHIVDIIYEDLYILALGIEEAGPNLTPVNFEKGLWSYGGGNGEYGPWSFNINGTDYWTPQHSYRFEWWNPNAISNFDQEQGSWVLGSTYYSPATTPQGPPPVFPNGPQ
ncbi:MAG TPA: hypothetical protein VFV02_04260, partial [Acidimicrobiales bacterium]|nr:hypothetical protein [Acidimicrobiales bacterium]